MFHEIREAMLALGPGGLLGWQWLGVILLLPVCWLGGRVLSWVSRRILRRLVVRTAVTWDDDLVRELRGPLTLAGGLGLAALTRPLLDLPPAWSRSFDQVLRSLLFMTVFWSLLRGVTIVGHALARSGWATQRPSSRALIPLGARVMYVVVLAVGSVAVLSQLGYPVASLVAGLGIGGLALALAGQKTIENLFGAFSLGIDQPFCEGDFVRVDDCVGTLEALGLRSTRIRTLDRTLVSIPNGRLSEMRLETFAARDRIRLACTLGLVYGTTAQQMRQILLGLEAVLRGHDAIWPDAVVVRFKEFASSSLDIEIMAWFQTKDWSRFQAIRQDVLLAFMDVVEREGSSFAFPTQTIHLAGTAAPVR